MFCRVWCSASYCPLYSLYMYCFHLIKEEGRVSSTTLLNRWATHGDFKSCLHCISIYVRHWLFRELIVPTKDSDDIYNQNYTCLTLISSRYLVNIVRVFALIVHISLEVISCNFSFVEPYVHKLFSVSWQKSMQLQATWGRESLGSFEATSEWIL